MNFEISYLTLSYLAFCNQEHISYMSHDESHTLSDMQAELLILFILSDYLIL